jgi:hypothetical protein
LIAGRNSYQEAKVRSQRARHVLFLSILIGLAGAMFAQEDQYRRGGACFYKDIDFGGPKFCMGPGERMAMVPPGFNDEISSIRIFGRTEITVYKNRDYGEPRLRLRDDVANLRTYQVSPGHSWNDPISSIEVANLRDYGDFDRDGACFYADYKGEKFCVQKGDRVGQLPRGFNDSISSVRLYGGVSVTVYKNSNFGGASLRLQDDYANLRSYQVTPGHSWNDQISSIEVH